MRRSVRLVRAIGALLVLALVPALGRAQTPGWQRVLSSVAFAGFAEVAGDPLTAPRASWGVAAVELDGTVEFGRAVQGAVAVVRDGNRAALGAGFLDLHVGGGRVAPRGAIFAERGVHLQAGRFDLPFGGDWAYFAAPDRGFGAAPLTTELVADGGLNSDGVRLFAVRARWNATTWLVRGGMNGRGLGARLGFTPLSNPFTLRPGIDRPLELGVSVHTDGREGRVADTRRDGPHGAARCGERARRVATASRGAGPRGADHRGRLGLVRRDRGTVDAARDDHRTGTTPLGRRRR